ncbi:NAD(P)-dependent oxidoreductase [Cupriavidus taiwanensis]|uniref:Dehydrogenase putative exported protein n=1 Tax=Cupriavidus taiwanensis (strain DSM 17343 / BCRC 17206 / CCUG 44338 / CIP 107171 / LMG 19424 / R1) TaxID=977880 RepID=B3R4X0_CUPTR|nr:NAD(P)-dependent oxidoreductase [Cupriavidus taiwanensis]CAQ69353.1 putative dehydrogenase; putative exported protein [Cupriavidus taiwanensis LMG 19424]
MKIAFLGLGTMGLPMAANLLKAGYAVRGWNRSPMPVARLAALGAQSAATPVEAVADADVLISMLADDAATRATLLDAQALRALRRGAIHVNMATISVALAAELAALHQSQGVDYVAAPVLGRVNVAEAGQLNILVAGKAEAIASVQPLLDVLGQKTWQLGERPEQANAAKLAVNFMIASAIGTMGEAVALAHGHGVDKAGFLELVTSTAFAAPVYKGYGQAIAEERFEPAGFKLALGLKDVRLALEAAEQANVPLPLASTLRDTHIESLAHGDGHLDWAALSRTSARRAAQA